MANEYENELVVVKYQDIGSGNQTTFLSRFIRGGWGTEFPDATRFKSVTKARQAIREAGIGGDIIRNYGYENEEVIEQS